VELNNSPQNLHLIITKPEHDDSEKRQDICQNKGLGYTSLPQNLTGAVNKSLNSDT